jgi:hypothetical protein
MARFRPTQYSHSRNHFVLCIILIRYTLYNYSGPMQIIEYCIRYSSRFKHRATSILLHQATIHFSMFGSVPTTMRYVIWLWRLIGNATMDLRPFLKTRMQHRPCTSSRGHLLWRFVEKDKERCQCPCRSPRVTDLVPRPSSECDI